MESTIGQLSVVCYTKDITWNIPNFRDLSEDVDYALDSPPFSCGDATWRLRVYPNGKSSHGSRGRIGLVLVRHQAREPEHRVQYTMGIAGRDGRPYEEFSGQYTFDGSNLEQGAFRFVDRSSTQSQAMAPSGEVSAFCRMRIDGNAGAAARSRIQPAVSNPSITRLQRDYLELLRSEVSSDVVLNVRGSEFRAHKVILMARSPVFATLLAGDPAGRGTAVVTVDCCEPDIFPDFLRYLYAGCIEGLTSGSAPGLYCAAEAYDMADLKQECLACMARTLSVDTFCDVMRLALQHDERELKEVATRFFAKNVEQVIVTGRWLAFLSENCGPGNDLFIAAFSRMQ